MTQISPIVELALENRGISVETALRFGIYTVDQAGQRGAGNVIVFPFWERGVAVNEKFRGPEKKFWQRKGGKKTFWNADALDDPALEAGHQPLIITEGEIDALSAIESGWPLTVSVPDGAPPEKKDEHQNDNNTTDQTGKFEYLWNNRDRLKHVKRFILAVDNDAPGRRLQDELVRRLSAGRCMYVTYPEGCKDLNDVLRQHGREGVTAVLNAAKPFPVRGLYRISEYPYTGALTTYTTGWPNMDEVLTIFPGEFLVVTGVPGHGKSTLVFNLLVNLAEQHGWTSAVYSPEMPVVPQIRDRLRRIASRRGLEGISDDHLASIDAWLNRHFVFIDGAAEDDGDETFSLDWLIDKATEAVLRDDVRVLVVDPWNELEHARERNESETDYISRAIRALKRFAKTYQVAVIVVTHPTKDVVGKDGKTRRPHLYDCSGSSHWYNKCDHGVVIDRPDRYTPEIVVDVKKSRFEEAGRSGEVRLKFDRISARFEQLDTEDQPHG